MKRVTIPMIARMKALRAVGLSFAAIGAVMEVDYGRRVSERAVRRYLFPAGFEAADGRKGPKQGIKGLSKPGSGGNLR